MDREVSGEASFRAKYHGETSKVLSVSTAYQAKASNAWRLRRFQLAIEPLHPMYAGDRSAVNTLSQANAMAETLDSDWVGVAVDVYHLWWDPDLEKEIARCGAGGNLLAFHICDWKTPTNDLLLDRGLMGEGCIPLRKIREWVDATGFDGPLEVEIFSSTYWEQDQRDYLKRILAAYDAHC